MIVLDATVLVYAVGEEHPLGVQCRKLLEAIADGTVEATTTVEVIQEFVHVRARRRDRADAADRGRELLRLLGPLLAPGDAELALALQLYEDHPTLGAFDSVLAATALLLGADALVSADRAFSGIRGLKWIDPAGPGIREFLGT